MGTPTAPSPLLPLVERLESAEALDPAGEKVAKTVRDLIGPGVVKDALAGTWLGHALHPLLTDVVIGSFVSATLLDVLGGDDDGRAAERLIGVGIATYGPTALTGTNDWADTEPGNPRVRRVGLAHAAANATALTLYAASLAARKGGNRGRGKLLGLAGAAALGAGGFLGAHLTFARGVGPNQTAFDEGPSDWTRAADSGDLTTGEPKAVVVDDTPVLLLRHADGIHAIHDRCSHRGCALTEVGEVDGEIITCGCHGSKFDLRDGSVQHGPATAGQPSYEVRESGGRVEIKLRS
ncbi:MAG: hypothetical protein QOJ07_920 [Thermoleophilaceae bacterium]|nr:hypothetical protein [Thermoleophilaceae bacterium]